HHKSALVDAGSNAGLDPPTSRATAARCRAILQRAETSNHRSGLERAGWSAVQHPLRSGPGHAYDHSPGSMRPWLRKFTYPVSAATFARFRRIGCTEERASTIHQAGAGHSIQSSLGPMDMARVRLCGTGDVDSYPAERVGGRR